MLFNSVQFLFCFLPVTLTVAAILSRLQNKLPVQGWLFAASLFFYGWWNPLYLPLLLGSMLFNYYVGIRLLDNGGKPLLIFGVAANLLLLCYFKYTNFLIGNVNAAFGTSIGAWDIFLPLGISFITFQKIAFLADCHAKKLPQKPGIIAFGLFVSFFPQLIAGPIVHHREIMPQFSRLKALNGLNITAGLSLLVIGLFKKLFIADSLDVYVTTLFSAASQRPLHMLEGWVAMLAYTFQIYFDFSGYSDMALGLAKMFGIRLPANFYSPYKSKNIIDFWRRWHMTLSRFLRDYLYIPLGGNRRGEARRYINLILTMMLGGLWHGAAWTFVIWGLLHGFYLACNHFWKHYGPVKIPALIAHAMTFLAVAVAWVFFRAPDTATALVVIKSLVATPDTTVLNPLRSSFDAKTANFVFVLIALCALISFCMPNALEIMRKTRPSFGEKRLRVPPSRFFERRLIWSANTRWGLVIGCLAGLSILKVLYEPSNVFLYFQF